MSEPRQLPEALLVLAAVLVLVGCGSQHVSAGPTPIDSGIDGHTMVDGGCPLVRQGTVCPDRPLSARIDVTAENSTAIVATTVSDSDGHFRLPLTPGTYVVRPTNLTGAVVPLAQPTTVTVHQGQFTTLTVHFDSGIR